MAMFTYNGVKLPALPDVCEYAIIFLDADNGHYILVCSDTAFVAYGSDILMAMSSHYVCYACLASSTEWGGATMTPDVAQDDFFSPAALTELVWSNEDIAVFNSYAIAYSGSKPIECEETSPGSAFDGSARILGWLMGKMIMGHRKRPVKTTLCSYNGTVLPALPEWDKQTYPYAYISVASGTHYFFCRETPRTVNATGGFTPIYNDHTHKLVDGVWEHFGGSAWGQKVIWANHDIYYIDSVEEVGGTLYLTASDPVPIQE